MSKIHLTDFEFISFPGGERHLVGPKETLASREPPHAFPEALQARLRSSDDILDLLLLAENLHRTHRQPAVLLLPYLPYARQDRAQGCQTAFSLKVFAKLINSLNYAVVKIFEPHSRIAETVINDCEVCYASSAFATFMQRVKVVVDSPLVLLPDAGAAARYADVLRVPEVAQAIKHRDPQTGRVEITFLTPNVIGRDLVIVDDICDGGATFIQLAEKALAVGAKSVRLFVAHGIFSKGLQPLWDAGIQEIGTTDSWRTRDELHTLRNGDPRLSVYASF